MLDTNLGDINRKTSGNGAMKGFQAERLPRVRSIPGFPGFRYRRARECSHLVPYATVFFGTEV